MAPALSIQGLHVAYPAYGGRALEAVRGLDLEVGTGEIMALVGEMGCGKTTLARAIMGALKRPGRITALQRFLDHIQAHDHVWVARRIDIARHWKATHPYMD